MNCCNLFVVFISLLLYCVNIVYSNNQFNSYSFQANKPQAKEFFANQNQTFKGNQFKDEKISSQSIGDQANDLTSNTEPNKRQNIRPQFQEVRNNVFQNSINQQRPQFKSPISSYNTNIPPRPIPISSSIPLGSEINQLNKELIFEGLKKMYKKKVLPLELASKFALFSSPPMSPSDFDAKPIVLVLGQVILII